MSSAWAGQGQNCADMSLIIPQIFVELKGTQLNSLCMNLFLLKTLLLLNTMILNLSLPLINLVLLMI